MSAAGASRGMGSSRAGGHHRGGGDIRDAAGDAHLVGAARRRRVEAHGADRAAARAVEPVGEPSGVGAVAEAARPPERIVLVDGVVVVRALGAVEHGHVLPVVGVVVRDPEVAGVAPIGAPTVLDEEGAVAGRRILEPRRGKAVVPAHAGHAMTEHETGRRRVVGVGGAVVVAHFECHRRVHAAVGAHGPLERLVVERRPAIGQVEHFLHVPQRPEPLRRPALARVRVGALQHGAVPAREVGRRKARVGAPLEVEARAHVVGEVVLGEVEQRAGEQTRLERGHGGMDPAGTEVGLRAHRRDLAVVAEVVVGQVWAGGHPRHDAGPYLAHYDLRDHGKVTPVRSQDNFSTCWIHSAMASLESCLLPGALFDFSENNLANHMGSRLDFEGRSDARLSTAYFARWDGPVLERADPYPRKGRSPEGLRPLRHVQEVLYLPDRRTPLDNDVLKWAVSTYGGVDTAMAFEVRYNNSATNAYYSTTAGLVLGHRVTCVGWDDGFPASRFKDAPPGDGAFLIKNSWGADWGDAGYFWISYYDANYGQDMAVFNGAKSAYNYDAIYQHDALGWSRSLGYGSDTAWFANRFHCAGSGTIRAVSFYTPAAGSSYEVRVAGRVADVAAAPVVAAGAVSLTATTNTLPFTTAAGAARG